MKKSDSRDGKQWRDVGEPEDPSRETWMSHTTTNLLTI